MFAVITHYTAAIKSEGEMTSDALRRIEDSAISEIVEFQESAGLGSIRRTGERMAETASEVRGVGSTALRRMPCFIKANGNIS